MKYSYYRVIQGNYGNGWDDEDFHETNSAHCFRTPEDRALYRDNLKAYRVNGCGIYRTVNRRELNKA